MIDNEDTGMHDAALQQEADSFLHLKNGFPQI